MIGGGGGGAGTAAESAATCTAVVRLISSFRSFQEATLPVAKPSAQAERRAPMLAIIFVVSFTACYSKFGRRKARLVLAGERWRASAASKLCKGLGRANPAELAASDTLETPGLPYV